MKTHVDIGSKRDLDTLLDLNRDYIRSVQTSDVRRFDEILADDFLCSNPDGSLIDRARSSPRPRDRSRSRASRLRTSTSASWGISRSSTLAPRSSGRTAGVGSGRYTDVWARRQGRWLAVSAHVTRC